MIEEWAPEGRATHLTRHPLHLSARLRDGSPRHGHSPRYSSATRRRSAPESSAISPHFSRPPQVRNWRAQAKTAKTAMNAPRFYFSGAPGREHAPRHFRWCSRFVARTHQPDPQELPAAAARHERKLVSHRRVRAAIRAKPAVAALARRRRTGPGKSGTTRDGLGPWPTPA